MGVKIDGEYINNFRFTIDIVLPSDSEKSLERMLEKLHIIKVGLKMNRKKIKVALNDKLTEQYIGNDQKQKF